MKYPIFFVLFILLYLPCSKAQISSRLIRKEDSSTGIASNYVYTNTIYKYSGNRGRYRSTPPPFANYLEFDSSIKASFYNLNPKTDSLITVHKFDGNNNRILEYTSEKQSYWLLPYIDSFAYDSHNNLIHYFVKGYFNGVFQILNGIDYSYNNKNQLIAYQNTSYPGPHSSELVTYDYDPFNNIRTETTSLYDSGKWVYLERINYVYSKTYLMQQIHEEWNGTAWQPDNQSIYTYNAAKLLSTIHYYSYSGNSWQQAPALDSNTYNTNGDHIIHYKREYSGHIKTDSNAYDQNHNIISTVTTTYDPFFPSPEMTLTTATYNNYHQPLVTRHYSWDAFNGIWSSNINYAYYERNYYEEYVTEVETVEH
jgi:hypothetical protein